MDNSENIATKSQNGKSSFKYKNEKGRILTIHHTVQENGKLVRVRLIIGSFNVINKLFVVIDCRGNVFVFDLAKKKFWTLAMRVPKACVIKNDVNNPNIYLVGTKDGQVFWLDVEQSAFTHSGKLSEHKILNISFPGVCLTPALAVVHSNHEAILLNLETYKPTYRLEFNQAELSLKHVAYMPKSDQIFTCFTNDALHVWSGISLNTIRIFHPIRMRTRYLMTKEPQILNLSDDGTSDTCFEINCNEIKDYSKGLINSFNFTVDGTVVCFTTLDNYVIMVSSVTFEIRKLIKFNDVTLTACWLFPKPSDSIILCQTTKAQLIMADIDNTDIKLMVEDSKCCRADISNDRELLCAFNKTGEVHMFYVPTLLNFLKSTQNCIQLIRTAMSQPKAVAVDCLDNNIRKLLTKDRLLPLLREYGQYPNKYRNLIWTVLLEIPCNKKKFLELVRMGTHPAAVELNKCLKLKDDAARRNLVKIFSCLAYWTKVFGYSDFLPGFIFPFVKILSSNHHVCFEILATILSNHCQLWFEFHPLEPLNYLAMCENILNHFDPGLGKFYKKMQITPNEYAWPMLMTAFSEVLDHDQWSSLWDHVISSPLPFMLFCAVAYNVIQRDTILRLNSKDALENFFHEQNAIDVTKFISKAHCLMKTCPKDLNPAQYMSKFVKLPKGVYPKFQNYPVKWVERQENDLHILRKEHDTIDAKIRELEREEAYMIDRLERGLQNEEYAKRMSEMEKQYQDIINREEERLGFQKKLLLLYQKELRQRKGKVIEMMDESARRRKQQVQESGLEKLLMGIERESRRKELDLALTEDNVKESELELLCRQYGLDEVFSNNDNFRPQKQRMKESYKTNFNPPENKGQQRCMIGNDFNEQAGHVFTKLNKIETLINYMENEFQSAIKCIK